MKDYSPLVALKSDSRKTYAIGPGLIFVNCHGVQVKILISHVIYGICEKY